MGRSKHSLRSVMFLALMHVPSVCLAQTVLTETCDASAALRMANGDLLVGDDESNILRRYDAAANIVSETNLGPYIGEDEADIEGVARLGHLAFWVTSHGRNRKGKLKRSRYRLFATKSTNAQPNSPMEFVGQTTMLAGAMVDPARWSNPTMYGALISHLGRSTILAERKVKRLAPKKEGLNIEALSSDEDGHLLLGLRNPLYHGKAIVLTLLNPQAVLNGEFPQFGAASLLDLGGRGIRGMVAHKGAQLLIAGPVDGGKRFALYGWSGRAEAPAQWVKDIPTRPGVNPEGIEISPGGVLLVNDEGSRLMEGRRCKDLAVQFRSFSTQTVKLKEHQVPTTTIKPGPGSSP